MIDRDKLERRIINCCKKNIAEPREKKIEHQQNLLNNFNIPTEISNDIMSLRETILSKYDDIILIAFSIEFGFAREFFKEKEIEEYSKQKYHEIVLEYPIRLDAVKITPNQYVCCISVTNLIEMFKSGKIKYNTNAQRAVKKISLSNGIEYTTFDVNTKSVQEIAQLLIDHQFVRNTITLRSNGIILYDQKKKEITINEDSDYDIIDGYHRLQGMVTAQQLSADSVKDEAFEVRIVDFDDIVVSRFIKQENKRNKINYINERTLKLKDGSTDIYDKLRMSGELTYIFQKKDIIIDKNVACMAISGIYFRHDEVKKSLEDIETTYREIKKGLISYLDYNMEYFNNPLSMQEILCLFVAISMNKSFDEYFEIYKQSLEIPNLYPLYSAINRRSVTRIVKFFEERS